jgi:hypothetical protein
VPRVEGIPVATYRWIQRSVEITPGGAEEVRTGLDVSEEELERCVVQLDLEGTVDLATRMAVSEKLDDLSARVLHLKENDAGLVVEPTEDDLDAIDTAGFVRVAMNRLREKLHGPDATTARRALALLYGLHHRGGG